MGNDVGSDADADVDFWDRDCFLSKLALTDFASTKLALTIPDSRRPE